MEPLNTPGRIAAKVAANTFIWWLANKAEDSGHDKVAKAIRWTGVTAQIGAAGWNVSVIMSLP